MEEQQQQQQPSQYEASAGDDASEDANAAGVAHQQRRRGDPRNKRRAGEFDPLLLSSHLLAASPGAAAAAGGEDEDALSNNTSAGTLLSTDSLDRSLAGGGNALGLALPSSDQQQAPDNNSHHHHHMDDDDDEWLTFPVVPTHVPNLVVADNASSALFSTSAPTNVASLSSSAVPTAAARGRSARRYSIAVGSTTLRDHLAPARPTLTSASSTTMPHNSSSPAAASGAARIPPRARAPTGPLPLLPTSSSSTSTSSSTVAAAHVIPLSSSASSSSFAAAALRKESKGEADYQKLRELAFKEDFRDMEQRQALYKAGRDKLGRQVVVFTLYNLGEKVDFERLLLYIIKVMDKLVEEEYALVFCQTHMTTAHRPPFTWLRKAYGMFQRKYKKNLKAAYIIHASTLVRMTLKLFKPFISSKFWKKLVYIDQVTDIYQYIRPDQLTLPDEVLTYNRESRATPLFGLPLAAGCARNPTTSSLPIVCERAFEILDVRAVEVEGIFRVSGSTALLNDLKQRFDRGEDVDLGFADVHTVAGLLKLYLRELPEPLMTFRLYESFIAAVRRSRDWEEIHNEIGTLVQELPTENYILSARLYTLLGRVGDNADKNLMNVNNLAIVIGPNVMRAPPDAPPDRLITDAGAVNTLVKLLIQHCRSLFPADTLPA